MVLAFVFVSTSSAWCADDIAGPIDQMMRKHINDNGPGAVVGVARNGEVLFERAYGLANIALHHPMKVGAVFDLASCSKQFTAMAVMILADRGRLKFDDEVRTYLPEFPEYDRKRPMRVDDLLHMTAGLPDYTDWFDSLESINDLDVVRAVAKKKLLFPVGSKYDYSNTAYASLALIVHRVSKEPFGEFLREQIFKPAGMVHTVVLENPKQVVEGRVRGYTVKKGEFKPARYDTCVVGDGQVMSCVHDLLLYDAALHRENSSRKRRFNGLTPRARSTPENAPTTATVWPSPTMMPGNGSGTPADGPAPPRISPEASRRGGRWWCWRTTTSLTLRVAVVISRRFLKWAGVDGLTQARIRFQQLARFFGRE